MVTVSIRGRFAGWLRDPPVPSAGLLLVYTLAVLYIVPLVVPLAEIVFWIILMDVTDPQHKRPQFELVTFAIPILTLTGLVGVWMSWYRERGRATLVYAALPVVAVVLAYFFSDRCLEIMCQLGRR